MNAKPLLAARPAAHRDSTAKKAKFLASLTLGNSVKDAAAYAGIHRRTAYDWRDQDSGFRGAWEDALEESVEQLEDEVRTRALDRTDRNSHILLMFLLKKHKPEYRENHKREVTVKHEKVQEFTFSQSDMDEAITILQNAKAPVSPETSE